jgi:hypothetical protein
MASKSCIKEKLSDILFYKSGENHLMKFTPFDAYKGWVATQYRIFKLEALIVSPLVRYAYYGK